MKKILPVILVLLGVSAVSGTLAASSLHHRPSYRIRVERELQTMSQHLQELRTRTVGDDLRPRYEQSLATLRQKYAAAQVAFEHWKQAGEAEKVKQRKAVDSALVDMRKFYTKVLNHYRRT